MPNKIKTTIFSICAIIMCFLIIKYSREISTGVINGMLTCSNVVIPSLFPFMVLSSFIAISPINKLVSKPISIYTKKVLKLPEELGSVLLISLVGGYPVGAKTLSTMLINKSINENTVSKMLCYCVNAGPSFIISAVGVAMYSNIKVGIILFVSQIISALLISFFTSLFYNDNNNSYEYKEHNYSYSTAFVKSVINSAESMLIICAFVVIFSGLIYLLQYSGVLDVACNFLSTVFAFMNIDKNIYKCIICGIFEVTSGCIATTRISGNISLMLCACFISFGGLSIIFQVMSCFNGYKIDFKPFIISRFFNCILTVIISYMFGLNKLAFTVKSNAVFNAPIGTTSTGSYIYLILMLILSSIMLLSINFKYIKLKKL